MKKIRIAFLLSLGLMSSWLQSQVSPEERQALQDFYNATGGPNWTSETDTDLTNDWDFSGPVTSNWHGITITDGKLTSLYLSNNELAGPLPTTIGLLTNLTYLRLNQNQLTGPIPDNIGLLTSLGSLYLNDNEFTGPIPDIFGSMTDMVQLILSGNQFTGRIPDTIASLSGLYLLNLSDNQLIGPISTDINHFSGLNSLRIENNRFEFGDLEHLIDRFYSLSYVPQFNIDSEQNIYRSLGEDITFTTTVSGSQNHYQWLKDGIPVPGAPDSPTLTLSNLQTTDSGVYTCEVTSDIVTGLTLTRNNIYLSVTNQDPGTHPGGPGENPEAGWNTITAWKMDLDGNLRVNTRDYFDCLGNPVQNQTFDITTGKIWVSSTLYDSQGRPALQSLSAPTDNYTSFLYKEDFIKNSSGNTYSLPDFEADPEHPTAVSDEQYSLGWYYSNNNSSEEFQDITNYPFSRTIYSELNPGVALRSLGGNKINNEWPHDYVFTMRASKELSQTVAFGESKYDDYKILKTVSRDVHGNENVVFTDSDGKTLAVASSGAEGTPTSSMEVSIGKQGYVDIHIAQGITTGFTVNGSYTYTVYNLITEEPQTNVVTQNLPNGFYRVAVTDPENYVPDTMSVSYSVNYYDYSLNEYDESGRLITSYQPLGTSIGTKPKTEYAYNTLGQLIWTNNTDEGEAKFKYREDGEIRFSQNSKQKDPNNDDDFSDAEFSYTNYDNLGRPVESGVLVDTGFDNLDPNDPVLPTGTRKEVTKTSYDTPIDTANCNSSFCTAISLRGGQRFVAGNVAKTYTGEYTSYYSYDIYGRLSWLIQEIYGLGVKTLDYEYHAITGLVTKVIYQKDVPEEQFVHRYRYNELNQLTDVHTSISNGNSDDEWDLQAQYTYYETEGLKRIEIADGTQGVDYVYNLAGQLKSINHPSLTSTNDPHGDSNDLFGSIIDYHSTDYLRENTKNIKAAGYGQDQLNENIKGIRWNNGRLENSEEVTYAYSYDRNSWLTDARFGTYDENAPGSENLDPHITDTDTYSSGDTTLEASKSVTLLEGFHAIENSKVLIRIGSDGFISQGGDYEVTGIQYDANGNIRKLNRNKQTENGSNAMDQLSYEYKPDKPNQLLWVDDAVTEDTNAQDIKDQQGDNYIYNKIGQLIEDHEYVNLGDPDDIIRYTYNTSGLVTEVSRKHTPLVKFFYNDRGHRIKKESYNEDAGLINRTYYVRDVSGSAMAIYIEEEGQNLELQEHPIYGSNRIGVYNRIGGGSSYELTDHLGNVRAVFAKSDTEGTTNENYSDYYPFGMLMPGRNIVGDYRYAFQGQEKDPETGKEAFELRLWDARIGRWLTVDPYSQFNSPYMGMGNNPVRYGDPDGGCIKNGEFCIASRIGERVVGDDGVVYVYDGDVFERHWTYAHQLDNVTVTQNGPYTHKAWRNDKYVKSVDDWRNNQIQLARQAIDPDLDRKVIMATIGIPLSVIGIAEIGGIGYISRQLTVNTMREGGKKLASNLGEQLISNGGSLEKLDIYDLGIKTFLKGNRLTRLSRSIVNIKLNGEVELNTNLGDIVIDEAGTKIKKRIHSKIDGVIPDELLSPSGKIYKYFLKVSSGGALSRAKKEVKQ